MNVIPILEAYKSNTATIKEMLQESWNEVSVYISLGSPPPPLPFHFGVCNRNKKKYLWGFFNKTPTLTWTGSFQNNNKKNPTWAFLFFFKPCQEYTILSYTSMNNYQNMNYTFDLEELITERSSFGNCKSISRTMKSEDKFSLKSETCNYSVLLKEFFKKLQQISFCIGK